MVSSLTKTFFFIFINYLTNIFWYKFVFPFKMLCKIKDCTYVHKIMRNSLIMLWYYKRLYLWFCGESIFSWMPRHWKRGIGFTWRIEWNRRDFIPCFISSPVYKVLAGSIVNMDLTLCKKPKINNFDRWLKIGRVTQSCRSHFALWRINRLVEDQKHNNGRSRWRIFRGSWFVIMLHGGEYTTKKHTRPDGRYPPGIK